jgi:hypothetical protein
MRTFGLHVHLGDVGEIHFRCRTAIGFLGRIYVVRIFEANGLYPPETTSNDDDEEPVGEIESDDDVEETFEE